MPIHTELARGTKGIACMHFNGASSKVMAYHYLIGLDKGKNGKVFQEQQINKFCLSLDFISTIELFFVLALLALLEATLVPVLFSWYFMFGRPNIFIAFQSQSHSTII